MLDQQHITTVSSVALLQLKEHQLGHACLMEGGMGAFLSAVVLHMLMMTYLVN